MWWVEAYSRQERRIQGFGGETWVEETTWKTSAYMEGQLIVDLQEMELEGMDWIDLAQDKERWQALMNAVMNIYTS